MKAIKIKVLQKMADAIIMQLQRETNPVMFDLYISIGLFIDDYAVHSGIFLD